MSIKSVPTRGRTLDGAAPIYDIFEPMLLLGKQKKINDQVISLLGVEASHRILDIGCGTGVLTEKVSKQLSAEEGGYVIGIDAAAKMVEAGRRRRESDVCRFEVAAAEKLPFESEILDSAFSTFFFHHVPADLKLKGLEEAYRVLKPGGRLVIVDMHIPTTLLGALTSHISRWLLFQPQIGENIRGILPGLIEEAGFETPELVTEHLGYVAVFLTYKKSDP